MTEETLKYMEVQPVAVVLSLRNCLWNELKFGKLYKIKNIKVQHLLTHSLLITLQKRCVGFAMHFFLIYITYCPSSAILLTPLICELQTCCSSEAHLLVWTAFVLKNMRQFWKQHMLMVIMILYSSFPENFVETVFCLTIHVDKACPINFHNLALWEVCKSFINSKGKAPL